MPDSCAPLCWVALFLFSSSSFFNSPLLLFSCFGLGAAVAPLLQRVARTGGRLGRLGLRGFKAAPPAPHLPPLAHAAAPKEHRRVPHQRVSERLLGGAPAGDLQLHLRVPRCLALPG